MSVSQRFSCLAKIVLMILLILTGCAGSKSVSPVVTGDVSPVTLGAGDRLELVFFSTPELNDIQTVRPDGIITLQLIGDVQVNGKTPKELQEELRTLFSKELRNPEITLIVRELNSRRIYVGGEVETPGRYVMQGDISVLEAVIEAGGYLTDSASIDRVTVMRSIEGKRVTHTVDLKSVLDGKNNEQFFLEPNDIVFVPQKRVVAANNWVETYLNNMFPRFLWTVLPVIFTYQLISENN